MQIKHKNNGFPGSRSWYSTLRAKNPDTNFTTGFTLIEMLVSVAIVTIIMSVILYDYSTFNDNLALSSAGQEMAILIRQAQTYGLSVKGVSGANIDQQFNSAYGIDFNSSPTNNNNIRYYVFADLNGDKDFDPSVDNKCGLGGGECIEKTNLRDGVIIEKVCSTGNGMTCVNPGSAQIMDITFKRPNPDAYFSFNDGRNTISGTYNSGKIILLSPKGHRIIVTVESTGQVMVGQVE